MRSHVTDATVFILLATVVLAPWIPFVLQYYKNTQMFNNTKENEPKS